MEKYLVEGNISVKAALLANMRPVYNILVDEKKKDKDTAYILRKAKEKHIAIEFKNRKTIDICAQGKTHGGIVAVCGERKFQCIQDVIQRKDIFLAIIEGIEDPFNFGYILRTLYAAGCNGVIIPPRNWTTATNVVTKSSAGASEYLNLFVGDDIEKMIQEIKDASISFICAQRSDEAVSLYDFAFPARTCIAIGGEMRGLSRVVLQKSDQQVYIPYRQDFKNAMTAAASTAIFAFELVRQRTKQAL